MDVSIIIVNYKTPQLVIDCIKSIRQFTTGLEYEIICVDNGSEMKDIQAIKNSCNDIIIIENKKNLGFGKANNIGVNAAQGKYLFFLNSDTILENNAILDFFRFSEDTISCGAVGCWLIDGDRKPTLSGAFFANPSNVNEEYVVRFRNLFSKNKKQPAKYLLHSDDDITSVDVVIGADLFCRADDFKRVGGFDEDFFMYHEEMHLCWKLKQKGLANYLLKSPQIVHLCGKSSGRHNIDKYIMLDGNMFIYLRKTGTTKISAWFAFKFFCIRIAFFIKNRYKIKEMMKYLRAVRNNESYKFLRKGYLKV